LHWLIIPDCTKPTNGKSNTKVTEQNS